MDFVLRGNLPLKQCESYMDERSVLRSARREVFSLHNSEIRAGCAPGNSVAAIVRAHADKIGASDDSALEMENVRRFALGARWLVMVAELIQPGYRVRICAAVVRGSF